MTITRVGTNQRYADGWDSAFSAKGAAGKRSGAKAAAKKTAPSKKAKPKKAAKKGRK